MLQDPTPPTPPAPPLPPEVFIPPEAGMDPVMVTVVLIVFAVVGGIVLWPLMRALARRIEGRGGDVELHHEVDELRVRVQELELQQQRLAEVEDRLEFAERLLAQRSEGRIGSG